MTLTRMLLQRNRRERPELRQPSDAFERAAKIFRIIPRFIKQTAAATAA
jgi:hypothetical protein